MDSLSLAERIDKHFPLPDSNRGYKPSEFIKTLILMQRETFSTQAELFISSADLNHPILHSLDDIIMSEGRINIIDATPIEAAQSGSGKGKEGQPTRDPEAGWHVKNNSRGPTKSIYGFSVHTGVDEEGCIRKGAKCLRL